MADTDTRIMDLMRRELEKDRAAKTQDLFDKAKKIDPEVSKLTIRQFHAKYPLQVKRALKGGGRKRGGRKATGRKRAGRRAAKGTAATKGTKRAAKKTAGKRARKAVTGKRAAPARRGRRAAAALSGVTGRGDVRGLLLQFAKQVASADDKADLVDVLAGIDTWVDRMVTAASR